MMQVPLPMRPTTRSPTFKAVAWLVPQLFLHEISIMHLADTFMTIGKMIGARV